MGLADTGRSQQQQGSAVGDPATGGQLSDLRFVEGRLGGEVEPVEIAQVWEMGDLGCHVDAPLVPAADLALAQKGDGLTQAELALGRLVQQRVELVADRGQLQPCPAWPRAPGDRGS